MGVFFREKPRGNNGAGGKDSLGWSNNVEKCTREFSSNDTINDKIYTIVNVTPDKNAEPNEADALKNNKMTHMTNGNDIIDGYKIAQFNTGNGLWIKNNMLLLCSLTSLDPDIVIISESNICINDNKALKRRRMIFLTIYFWIKCSPTPIMLD